MDEEVIVDEVLPDGPVEGAQGNTSLTADEVSSIVSDALAAFRSDLSSDLDGRDARGLESVTALVGETERRLASTIDASAYQGEDVTLLTMEEVFAYLPVDAPSFATSFLTPLLWGIGAGLFVFVLGYLWASFLALLGLASDK